MEEDKKGACWCWPVFCFLAWGVVTENDLVVKLGLYIWGGHSQYVEIFYPK